MNPYILKRFDKDIAILNLSNDGMIINSKVIEENIDLAPLHKENSKDWLKNWWNRRAVPISQGNIKQMLKDMGLGSTEEYLVKNLALSLTDYYWIVPMGITLTWKDVNLFENRFSESIRFSSEKKKADESTYTPNSSLQGDLDKSWTIYNGERGLIKGNNNDSSAESINEVIASKLHEMQGFLNFTRYELIEVKNKPYKYGCYSKLFTSTTLELISAYDVVMSKKQSNDANSYEQFISVCNEHGLLESTIRPFLEYQIMTDFIMTNTDRHLANIAVLRDAESLEFVKPAPIFDNGKSMFVKDYIPKNDKDMLNIETNSFLGKEIRLLGLVKDKSLVDVSKLPNTEYIRRMYLLDPNMPEGRIEDILGGYERKIELFTKWQRGKVL